MVEDCTTTPSIGAAADDAEVSGDASDSRDTLRQLLQVAMGLAVLSVIVTSLAVYNAPRFSLLDESTHLDYTWRAANFEVPRTGQELSHFTLDRWSCRGQPNEVIPPCGSDAPAGEYPSRGLQYNAKHPPTYYFATGVTARALSFLSGQDFQTAARWIGAVWMFGAMFALYVVLRSWRVPRLYAVAGGATLSLIPPLVHSSTTVTNDAPAALCGVGAVYILGRVVVHKKAGWLVPALVAGLIASTKLISAAAILTVALILMGMDLYRRRSRDHGQPSTMGPAIAIVAAVGVVYLAWDFVQGARTVPNYTSPIAGMTTEPLSGLPFDEWLPSLVAFRVPGDSYYLDPLINTSYILAWASAFSPLSLAAAFVVVCVFRRRSIAWYVGVATLLGTVVAPLAVQVEAWTLGRYFVTPSTRYNISLLPLAVAAMVLLLWRYRWRWQSVGLIACAFVAVVGSAARVLT